MGSDSHHDETAAVREYLRRIDAGEAAHLELLEQSRPDVANLLRAYAAGDKSREEVLAAAASPDTPDTTPPQQELPAPALSGDLARRYRIERPLGSGAMGDVYLAQDLVLKRAVALKFPRLAAEADREAHERLLREARAAATLSHPNICPVYDAGESAGVHYIVMAYIDGRPLTTLVGAPDFGPRQMARTLQQIAAAIQHAHDNGVIHRDLKPANILIDRDGNANVMDFGIARQQSDEDQSRITAEGTIVGTPSYMSPEQVECEVALNGATDVYSLGVIFYELLTGQLPFRGSVASILGQIVRDRPKHPARVRAGVDEDLTELCLHMLEKEPKRRPDSMRTVSDRLEEWLHATSEPGQIEQQQQREKVQKRESAKEVIRELIQRGQFAQAIRRLEQLSNSADQPKLAEWAEKQLPRIREQSRKLRNQVPEMVATATELIDKHDYAQAAQILQDIPQTFRDDVAQQLLDEAIEKQDEVDLLLTDLRGCIRTQQCTGIEENAKRLLQLKPRNRFARELWDALKTYKHIPAESRRYRFDRQGKLLPLRRRNPVPTILALMAVAVLAVFAISWGVSALSGNGRHAVHLGAGKGLLADGPVTVEIEGVEYTLDADGLELSLKAGEYTYQVRRGESLLVESAQLVVRADAVNRVQVEPGPAHRPRRDSGSNPQAQTPQGHPAAPVANAPFDAAEAKQLQQQTADILGVPSEYTTTNGIVLRLIPAGEFDMGASPALIQELVTNKAKFFPPGFADLFRSQGPKHRVRLSRPFYIGRLELTQRQFETVMGRNPSAFRAGSKFGDKVRNQPTDGFPVDSLNWLDAVEFCNRLSIREQLPLYYAIDGEDVRVVGGSGYRLPTEAEWEFACRAGTTTSFYFGATSEKLSDYAWHYRNADGRTHTTGQRKPNAFGLHDMLGNVTEVVQDWYSPKTYAEAGGLTLDPTGPVTGDTKVQRGGFFSYTTTMCSSTMRNTGAVKARYHSIGMRVARSVDSVDQQRGTARNADQSWREFFVTPDFREWKVEPADAQRLWAVNAGEVSWRGKAIQDGSILWFRERLESFRLEFEYKLGPQGDAGVYLRAPKHARITDMFEGLEIVLSGRHHSPPDRLDTNGGLWHIQAPTADRFRSGEWNAMTVEMRGQSLEVTLNGETVLRAAFDALAPQFPGRSDLTNTSGFLGLQAYAGSVAYRRVRLRTID